MAISNRYILNQLPVLGALVKTAVGAATGGKGKRGEAPSEGPLIIENLPPRPSDMIDDYIAHVGGDRATYSGVVPSHYFPQWCFPSLNAALGNLPYPMAKAVNGGCTLEIGGPIKRGMPLQVEAKLVHVDDNGYRAILKTQLITSTSEVRGAVVAHMYTIVPYKKKDANAPKKPRPTVPESAELIERWSLSDKAGLEFAKLTGDFNPIHWVKPYAKASGFKTTILHGFSTMARSYESLYRAGLFKGEAGDKLDVKFTSPLSLPHEVGIYRDGAQIYVGDNPGAKAYMTGVVGQSSD